MTQRLLSLSAGFWALMGGAVISAGVAVYIDTLQGEALPEEWWLLLASASCFVVSGVAWIGLSLSLEKVEDATRSLPSVLSAADKESYVSKLRNSSGRRLKGLLWGGGASAIAGLAILPIRLWWW